MMALVGKRKWHIGWKSAYGGYEPLCGSPGVNRKPRPVEDDFFLGSNTDDVCRRCLASVAPMWGSTV